MNGDSNSDMLSDVPMPEIVTRKQMHNYNNGSKSGIE